MPTIRETVQARIASLRAEADALEAKITAAPAEVATLLESEAHVVVAFVREWAEHLFKRSPAPAAAAPAAPVTAEAPAQSDPAA